MLYLHIILKLKLLVKNKPVSKAEHLRAWTHTSRLKWTEQVLSVTTCCCSVGTPGAGWWWQDDRKMTGWREGLNLFILPGGVCVPSNMHQRQRGGGTISKAKENLCCVLQQVTNVLHTVSVRLQPKHSPVISLIGLLFICWQTRPPQPINNKPLFTVTYLPMWAHTDPYTRS